MKAYFVRKAANREVVGLFVVSSLGLLAALVDECCDPAICEYALARMGGLLIAATTDATWPRPDQSDASGFEQAQLSQHWQDDLSASDSALEWKPLAAAARRMIRSLSMGAAVSRA